MEKLKIIYTSDVHGCLFPENKGSFLQCVGEFEKDGNTLVIDGGDSLVGTPLLSLLKEEGKLSKVLAQVYNYGGYDYFTLGNHDFDYGYELLKEFAMEMNATCLTANIMDTERKMPIMPYDIVTLRNGLKVGICGIVTDRVGKIFAPEVLGSLRVGDALHMARQCYQRMTQEADVTICVYHGGFEEDLDTGKRQEQGNENIGGRICKELDFDVLLTAHQHREIQGRYYHGTYVMQLPAKGEKYGEIFVDVEAPMMSIRSALREPGVFLPPKLIDLLAPYQKKVEQWMKEELCLLYDKMETTSDKISLVTKGSPIADLLHHVQLSAVEADISLVCLPNDPIFLPEVLTVGDFFRSFPHANQLVVVEMTGEILYEGLIRSASYIHWTPKGFVVDPRFLQPKPQHYNYDFFANVTYTILCNPYYEENQVSHVKVGGEPLDLEKTYRVTMMDYRASGAGGYENYHKCPVVQRCEKTTQQLLLDYFREKMPRAIPLYHGVTVEA